jgi:hypothetical protein
MKGAYDPRHGLRFDTTIPGDRDLHRLRFGRLDVRNLAAQAANLARSGNPGSVDLIPGSVDLIPGSADLIPG